MAIAFRFVTTPHFGSARLLPDNDKMASWVFFSREDPDYRNFDAFDFVIASLMRWPKRTAQHERFFQRSVMVERAAAGGIPRHDVEVAITYEVMAGIVAEKDGVLRFPNNHGVRGLPSEQLKIGHQQPLRRPYRARAFPIVKDVIDRRTDGRPMHAEPLDAFADELDKLGYGNS